MKDFRSRKLKKFRISLRKFFRFLHIFLDLVLPRNCVVSKKAIHENAPNLVSKNSISKLLRLSEKNLCDHCGAPILSGNAELCEICETQKLYGEFQFKRSRSVVVFDEFSKFIVYDFKYKFASRLSRDISRIAAQNPNFTKFLENSILVPVPLHRSRMIFRGYNQCNFLANEFAKIATGTTVKNLLIRTKKTTIQAHLPAASRRENVKDAFKVRTEKSLDPFARYVIIDDVFTTGATLSECAKALRKAGAVLIDAATFARALPFEAVQFLRNQEEFSSQKENEFLGNDMLGNDDFNEILGD